MLQLSVSVVIPARNEATTVGPIASACAAQRGVVEVIVVDDGSTDDTAAVAANAGAIVVTATAGPGKGSAIRDGVAAAGGALVVFCDADLVGFDGSIIGKLAAGASATNVLVKGTYARAGEGGRVTELTAKPAIRLLHPEVAHIDQPLGGEYAAWREALLPLRLVRGYGVDLALLLDLADTYGAAAVTQVDLGIRRHRNRPLAELTTQAQEVLAVALHRAGVPGIRVEECPPLQARRRSA